MYVRGFETLSAVAPGVDASEVFTLLHWRVLAPPGNGSFRPVDMEQIAALDPDELIFSDPRVRHVVSAEGPWKIVRAVREKHTFIAPALPFGWVGEPASLNRLLGMDWLWRHGQIAPEIGEHEYEMPLAAMQFYPLFFGRPLSNAQLEALVQSTRPLTE
jgi:iron complex transport system substrate-binding protein